MTCAENTRRTIRRETEDAPPSDRAASRVDRQHLPAKDRATISIAEIWIGGTGADAGVERAPAGRWAIAVRRQSSS